MFMLADILLGAVVILFCLFRFANSCSVEMEATVVVGYVNIFHIDKNEYVDLRIIISVSQTYNNLNSCVNLTLIAEQRGDVGNSEVWKQANSCLSPDFDLHAKIGACMQHLYPFELRPFQTVKYPKLFLLQLKIVC